MGTNANPLSAPYRALRALAARIPNPGARAAASFALAFAVSLGVGRAFEIALSDKQVIAAVDVQKQWMASLRAFTPLALAAGYVGDISAVRRGELQYRPPPKLIPFDPASAVARTDCLADLIEAQAAERACYAAAPGLSGAACLVSPDTPGCAALNRCLDAHPGALLSSPAACASPLDPLADIGPRPRDAAPVETGAGVPIQFAPFVALFRSASRIIGENGVSPIVAVGQIGLGALAFCVATFIASNGARIGFDNLWANLLFAPACVIALASLSALVIQWLMIAALAAFSWATALAAACCGASSVGAACWYCVKKLGEKGAEHVLTSPR
jgi:hypothetical protein